LAKAVRRSGIRLSDEDAAELLDYWADRRFVERVDGGLWGPTDRGLELSGALQAWDR
jgi:hypothetical protein